MKNALRIVALAVASFSAFTLAEVSAQSKPGAKAMFYDPADSGPLPVPQPAPRLRPLNPARPMVHCGIHYWLENDRGKILTESTASAIGGSFTVHLRSNIGGGVLTVWDMEGAGRELTPKEGQWSGYSMDGEYVVPGMFEFKPGESAKHLIIVCARSQAEVAGGTDSSRERLTFFTTWRQNGELWSAKSTNPRPARSALMS